MRYATHRAEQLVSAQDLHAHLRPKKLPESAGMRIKAHPTPDAADRQLNIMVADHDPGMRRTVSDYLGQNNMRVAGASGKQDMSRLLAAQQFSMVVLDLQLGQESGQEDGLDLLRELRAHSDMPVITLAGQQHDEIADQGGAPPGGGDSRRGRP